MSLESLALDQYEVQPMSENDSDEEQPTYAEKCISAFRLALEDLQLEEGAVPSPAQPPPPATTRPHASDRAEQVAQEPRMEGRPSLPPKPPGPGVGGASSMAAAQLASPPPPPPQREAEEDAPVVVVRQRPAVAPKPQIDIVRYSMANAKDDYDLDDILHELLELENNLTGEAGDQLLLGITPLPSSSSCQSHLSRPADHSDSAAQPEPSSSHLGPSLTVQQRKIVTLQPANTSDQLDHVHTTESCGSPDNDSAYGDSSSTECSSNGKYRHSEFSSNDSYRGSLNTPSPTNQVSPKSSSSGSNEQSSLSEAELKALKIKEALEKMKEAKRKKIYVKFFLEDDSTKGLLIDERWTVADTMAQLAVKLGIALTAEHAIVEEYPELHIKRIYEDHEMVVENIEDWLADSKNKLHFVRRPDKYNFLHCPQQYLLTDKYEYDFPAADGVWSMEQKRELLQKYTEAENVVPELEGYLLLKADGKKSWKKHYFVLRSSGLYYSPKGKMKSAKDLQCLMTVYNNQIYTCMNWQKKYKAPTPFGFAIKHPKIQVKTSKYIKYVCTEDEKTLKRWITALRITKNGVKALEHNEQTLIQFGRKVAPIHTDIHGSVHSQLGLGKSRPTSVASGTSSLRISLSSTRFGVGESQPSTSKTVFDQDDCGTIKRQPPSLADIHSTSTFAGFRHHSPMPGTPSRSSTTNSVRLSNSTSTSGEHVLLPENGESDSDEEQFPPPPDFVCVYRESSQQPVVAPVQPVAAVLAHPPPHVQYRSPAPLARPSPAPPAPALPGLRLPPPPPKRNDATRLHSVNPQHQQQMDLFTELQQATARQKQRIEGN